MWVFDAKVKDAEGSDPPIAATFCPSDLLKSALIMVIVGFIMHTIAVAVLAWKYGCGKK